MASCTVRHVAEVDGGSRPGRIGMFPSSCDVATMELIGTIGIWSCRCGRCPKGLIVLPAVRAATTSSGDSV